MLANQLNISDELISKCIHCGLCLPTCPTYNLTYNEQSSPRGRIQMMKNVFENTSTISEQFVDEMNFCLDCQACQTACPAGVKYGSLVEEARNLISLNKKEKTFYKISKSIFLNKIIASTYKLKLFSKLLYYFQKLFSNKYFYSTIFKIFENLNLSKLNLLPKINFRPFDETIDEYLPSYGKARFDVIFPYGCIMNVAFSEINSDTVEVLRKAGCNVLIPKNQTCCGSLHFHNGEKEGARELAIQNIKQFNNFKFDYIIQNSAGCGAMMKHYNELFSGDSEYFEIVNLFSKKVKDFSEFLYEINYEPPTINNNQTVTYHDACHLIHSQLITNEPRYIISKTNKNTYIELNEASWCCGSAGIYNVTHTEDSLKILDRKMDNIEKTYADIVIASNPGCLLQIQYGIKKRNLNIKAMHLATYLNQIQ